MSQKRGIVAWIIFYGAVSGILLIVAALFLPAASVLRSVGERSGQGPVILIPAAFLLLAYLFAFLKARALGKRSRWIAAYGWLMGGGALILVLLLWYLGRMTGRS